MLVLYATAGFIVLLVLQMVGDILALLVGVWSLSRNDQEPRKEAEPSAPPSPVARPPIETANAEATRRFLDELK